MEFKHETVLLNETVDNLNINPNGIYVDGTLGGGGHSELICSKLSGDGLLIGIDQDEDALDFAKMRLRRFSNKIIFVNDNFSNIKDILDRLNIKKINGIVLDLGVSSYQLDEGERGFSYMQDAELDMRMDRKNMLTAKDVVNTYSEEELYKVIKLYGEEKWALRISKFIVEARNDKEIETTGELVEIIKKAIPSGARRNGPHPAKRTFQAIRIEVNNELDILEETVKDIAEVLETGGRISVITFHSLEDRIIKNVYKELSKGCICPPELPICQCNNEPIFKIITRKPIYPSDREIENNPRSRSAKLRVAERI
ncbi:16S rRNA (cytosine(1402)-N(4))-methyltransferase RsmH [Paramaledivibacter caminithermalis]|uniref:Ribosomal RNA small subunit methyltransferase H n=1 Tax=Paramaledivibacter caminithermalis (strain DSM 15212 / CIP 107654 / DViRD3) TaxID=1121301 RepID=A0A1M6S263_PARC5|nr:16S rRNA (cytosine(1402)-N(4))-methyltransferase RsmH [Paramaledivibacter caminithermalis]SHK38741.1 16S rRNA (cytosine1402-N4)-methyltransferase [Paramaledivibacter caminithermalis DSM 15212]